MPEPNASSKDDVARWWETISHHPLWAAVIAALLAAAIAAHSGGIFGGSSPTASSSTPSHATSALPAAAVMLSPALGIAVIPKPITDVPEPPPYANTEAGDHCGPWWKGWFQQQHAASLGLAFVEVSAPQGDPVTITRISAHVFRAYKPPGISIIECMRGAGPISGTAVSLDLDHPSVLPTVASSGGGHPMPLPEAAIAIDPGHAEYLSLAPKGARGFYEWSATFQFTVNQRTETREVGSLAHPLRSWLDSAPTVNNSYDYEIGNHSWRIVGGPNGTCTEALDTCPPATPGAPPATRSPATAFTDLIPGRSTACGNGIGVVSNYDCEIAKTVIETMKAAGTSPSGHLAIIVHFGLLQPLAMECTLGPTADVCRSTDNQNLTVALLH
jgi:hypothetical protein